VKIYQRAVRVRGTVTRMQAIMRGRRQRRAVKEEAAKATPILSTATTPATGSRPRTEGRDECSSGGEEHMVMATLRGPRALLMANTDRTMGMAPMEESVDFEDSMESAIGSSVSLEKLPNLQNAPNQIAVNTPSAFKTPTPIAVGTPSAKLYTTPPKPIVPISPDTPEEESPSPIPVARRRASAIETAFPATSVPVVATPKTQDEMDFEMLEAHRVLEGEMEKLKGAMEKERERQRERVRERMKEKQRESIAHRSKEEDAGTTEGKEEEEKEKEVGPVVFYPTHNEKNVGGAEGQKLQVSRKEDKLMRKKRGSRSKIEAKTNLVKKEKQQERKIKKPPIPSFTTRLQRSSTQSMEGDEIVGTEKKSLSTKAESTKVERQNNPSQSSNSSNDPEIKKVRREMINAKMKYTQNLKKVLAKEQNLTKKEGELKKKEERVTKLADNLRRQRVTLKKEIQKARKPSELVKQIAELTPVKASQKGSPKKSSPKSSPNRFNSSSVLKAPKLSLSERGAAKMGKLLSVYTGSGGSDAVDNVQGRGQYITDAGLSSNTSSLEDEDMKAYHDRFLSGNTFKGSMGLMGLGDNMLEDIPSNSSHTKMAPSSSPKFSAYKAPNPLLQPPTSTIGSGPLSVSSAFGMNESGGGTVKIWTDEYNKEMKRRMEEAAGQGVGLGGVRNLSMARTGEKGPIRSTSARINASNGDNNKSEDRKEDSESSRESRSAPEDNRRSMNASLDLLIGSSEKAIRKRGKNGNKRVGRGKKNKSENKSKGSANGSFGGIIRRETRLVRGRSKKKTPTKPLQGRSPLKNIKKASTSPSRKEPKMSQEEIDKAKGSLNHILSRKRMLLTDIIKSSSGGVIKANKLRQELDDIMGDFGFGDGVGGIMELAKQCVSVSYAGMVDLKSLERSCRVSGGKGNLSKGIARGIVTKGKAKKVYDGFRFSFEASVDKENEENRDQLINSTQMSGPMMKDEIVDNKVTASGASKFTWLASFDQRMAEALKQAGDD